MQVPDSGRAGSELTVNHSCQSTPSRHQSYYKSSNLGAIISKMTTSTLLKGPGFRGTLTHLVSLGFLNGSQLEHLVDIIGIARLDTYVLTSASSHGSHCLVCSQGPIFSQFFHRLRGPLYWNWAQAPVLMNVGSASCFFKRYNCVCCFNVQIMRVLCIVHHE